MSWMYSQFFGFYRRAMVSVCTAVCVTLSPTQSLPQGAPPPEPPLLTSMIADEVFFDQERQFYRAMGDVQIFFEGLELRAPSVAYDLVSNRVIVDGPLVLIDEAGRQALYGDFADMSADLRDGVITSARQLIDRNLQIASDQLLRREGRYTELQYVRASACEVCSESDTPLWELRARRAVHDQEAQTITYRDAQLRVLGYPILYTPWLRTPDPTVSRASGLLAPTYSINSSLGTRVGLPYFKMLGDSADVTVTPVLTLDGGRDAGNYYLQTLRGRYRQALGSGYVELHGAVSQDDLTDDSLRAFLFSNGRLQLGSGFDVSFQSQSSSDRAYVGTYDFFADRVTTFGGEEVVFDEDRLNNFLRFSRHGDNELIAFDYTGFSALRDPGYDYGEPNRVLNSQWTLFEEFEGLPGALTLNFGAQANYNEFGASNPRQRDVDRLTGNLRWSDTWLPGEVLRVDSDASIFLDRYGIHDDPANPDSQSSASGLVSTRLSWPVSRAAANGATHSWSPSIGFVSFSSGEVTMPSVDGSIDEIDPFNYSSLERFRRVNRNQNAQYNVTTGDIGISYRLDTASGYHVGVSAERDFILSTDNSRLTGGELYSTSLGRQGEDFQFSLVSQFNPDFNRISDRLTASLDVEFATLTGDYHRVDSDEAIGSPEEVRRWAIGLNAQITERIDARLGLSSDAYESETSYAEGSVSFDNGTDWNSSLSWLYDRDGNKYDHLRLSVGHSLDWGGDISALYAREDDTVRRYGLSFNYHNECVLMRAQIMRVDNRVTSLDPQTEFSLNFELGAFGSRNGAQQVHRCG